jgi:hypothetical protein
MSAARTRRRDRAHLTPAASCHDGEQGQSRQAAPLGKLKAAPNPTPPAATGRLYPLAHGQRRHCRSRRTGDFVYVIDLFAAVLMAGIRIHL